MAGQGVLLPECGTAGSLLDALGCLDSASEQREVRGCAAVGLDHREAPTEDAQPIQGTTPPTVAKH